MSPTVLAVETRPRGVAAITLDTDESGSEPTLLPLESVVLNRLRSGTQVSDDDWRGIRREGALALATRRGLDILARRQRTEHELRRALGRSYDEEAVEGAVVRLRELGYLDDAAVARSFTSSGRAAERGSDLLRQELRQRGVDESTVVVALEDHDDLGAAYTAAVKRARTLRNLDPDRRTRRLYDFLRRRGFSDAVVRRAVASVLAEAHTDSSSNQ